MLGYIVSVLIGFSVASAWYRRSASEHDYYIVETIAIMAASGGSLSDALSISRTGAGISAWYDVTCDGETYLLCRKGEKKTFATKRFELFDNHGAALQRFELIDRLHLGGSVDVWSGHTVILWAALGKKREAIPNMIIKGEVRPRKLMETKYSALHRLYSESRSSAAES